MEIDLIAGARPNFVKIAALVHANKELNEPLHFRIIHSGQHYDDLMSGSFFRQLQLPAPDINLQAGSGSQAEQTSTIMVAYEKVLEEQKPHLCIVVGDVTSSMACAITAKKMQVKVAHIEAGIRSQDWSMPEEINRVLIDSIADIFFTTSRNATENLIKSGASVEKVHFVGNTMIDSLLRFKPVFRKPEIWNRLHLREKEYFVVTLHRPGNVDAREGLELALREIANNAGDLPVIFPVHPRTATILGKLESNIKNLHLSDPLEYLEFNYLVERAKAVITDSGGISEETTVLGVPCLTVRDNTERPETITIGTNDLLGTNPSAIAPALEKLLLGNWKQGGVPELWDGQAGIRIVQILKGLKF